MKRLYSLLLVISILSFTQLVEGSTYFRVTDETKTTTYIDGVRHQSLIGTINYNGTETTQKINYLGADQTKSNISIVTADNYLDHGWGKGTLEDLKNNIHNTYPNYQVVGGVNGDFFGANGIPIEAFIRDFSVISAGLGTNRTVLGFKDNGEVVFRRPTFDGYEIRVYTEDNELKTSIEIDKINQLPTSGDEVTVFFDNYEGTISNDYHKIELKATETHRDDYGATYYGKGVLLQETTNDLSVDLQRIVIVGNNINHDELITENDYVVIQKNVTGAWEDVRFAISGWEILVSDGKATETFTEGAGPNYRHPRTAIGIKEDGSVFFLVVDGRDYDNGFLGVTEYELSQLMLYYGAVNAFNLDGGGSTAMLLKGEDGEYNYVNTPSDGHPRPVTNGVFFVIGEHIPPVNAIWPDNREQLDVPENIHVSQEGYLSFSSVLNATTYEIIINGEKIKTTDPFLYIDGMMEHYDIQIRALDDSRAYAKSEYTETVTFYVYSENMQSIIDYFINYTKEETED